MRSNRENNALTNTTIKTSKNTTIKTIENKQRNNA